MLTFLGNISYALVKERGRKERQRGSGKEFRGVHIEYVEVTIEEFEEENWG